MRNKYQNYLKCSPNNLFSKDPIISAPKLFKYGVSCEVLQTSAYKLPSLSEYGNI